jgi:hypothetical protein
MMMAAVMALLALFKWPMEYMIGALCNKYSYLNWLRRDLRDCETILDVGCGAVSPVLKIGYGPRADAVDIFAPYVMMHRIAGNYRHCKTMNILEAEFQKNSYDAVVVCDVFEHLPRNAVFQHRLIEALEKTARKKVIIFTPNGDVENYEQDGNVYQRHVSAWEPEDFESRGYSVKGSEGLRHVVGKGGSIKYEPRLFFALLALVSQPFIYNRPKLAAHSYAVKEVENEH